jgi:D-serine deaminase-like pyridoxal phosphate-dependent protein
MSQKYDTYLRLLKGLPQPCLFLDLNAFEENLNWVLSHTSKKIRIATKSIRSVEVLRRLLDSSQKMQGLMSYSLKEALWLREQGFKDILMGYPTTDKDSLKKLAENPVGITLMIDLPEHLNLLEGLNPSSPFQACIDLDLSFNLPGLRFGVFRSSLVDIIKVESFLKLLKKCTTVQLSGLMGYEAQIAGVVDKHHPSIKFLKTISIKKLKTKRAQVIELLKSEGHHLHFVNGGGTGSLSSTSKEEGVTEITVGSGFFAPHLFDHYENLKLNPALFFSLPIVRKPQAGIYTALGGGYIASGSIDPLKAPLPYLPKGAKLLKHEGAGEVQTPFNYEGELELGDLLIMRHAKSGEVCERFNEIHLIKDKAYLGAVKTYRGQGQAFL